MHRSSAPSGPLPLPSRREGWPNGEPRLARQGEKAVAIDMLLKMIGKQIERGVDIGFIVEAGRLSADESQPVLPLPVVGQQAMDVAAGHAAIAAHRTVSLAIAQAEQRPQRARGAADMYLLALEWHRAGGGLFVHPFA